MRKCCDLRRIPADLGVSFCVNPSARAQGLICHFLRPGKATLCDKNLTMQSATLGAPKRGMGQ